MRLTFAPIVFFCLVVLIGCKKEHDSTSDNHSDSIKECTCLEQYPLDYVMLLTCDKYNFQVQHTVKWASYRNNRINGWPIPPDKVYRIVNSEGKVFFSMDEPEVDTNGLMKFINAKTGQQEATHYTGVKWTIEPLTTKMDSVAITRHEYGVKYYKQFRQCEASTNGDYCKTTNRRLSDY